MCLFLFSKNVKLWLRLCCEANDIYLFFCLQCGRVSDLVFLHPCLCLSVTGLCPPLEKRLLPIAVHSSTWLLLHHSSHPPGPDQTAHPLLRRYSRGLRRGRMQRTQTCWIVPHFLVTANEKNEGKLWGVTFGNCTVDFCPQRGNLNDFMHLLTHRSHHICGPGWNYRWEKKNKK